MRFIFIGILGFLFAPALANKYAFDGKVLNQHAIVSGKVTKTELMMNVDVEPYVNVTCYHKRTTREYPCYKWIDLDLKHDKCLHSVENALESIQIWFDPYTFKVKVKHYVSATAEAKAITHTDMDMCS
jgi:hypothetical protein